MTAKKRTPRTDEKAFSTKKKPTVLPRDPLYHPENEEKKVTYWCKIYPEYRERIKNLYEKYAGFGWTLDRIEVLFPQELGLPILHEQQRKRLRLKFEDFDQLIQDCKKLVRADIQKDMKDLSMNKNSQPILVLARARRYCGESEQRKIKITGLTPTTSAKETAHLVRMDLGGGNVTPKEYKDIMSGIALELQIIQGSQYFIEMIEELKKNYAQLSAVTDTKFYVNGKEHTK